MGKLSNGLVAERNSYFALQLKFKLVYKVDIKTYTLIYSTTRRRRLSWKGLGAAGRVWPEAADRSELWRLSAVGCSREREDALTH